MKKIKNNIINLKKFKPRKKKFSERYDNRFLITDIDTGVKMPINDKSKKIINEKFKQGVYIGPIYLKYREVDIPVGLSYITIKEKDEKFINFKVKLELSKSDLPYKLIEHKKIKVEYSFLENLDCYAVINDKFILN